MTKYIPDGSQTTTTTTKIVRQARQSPNALAKQPSARVCSQCTFSRPYRRKHSSSAAHHHHTVGFAVFFVVVLASVCVRVCGPQRRRGLSLSKGGWVTLVGKWVGHAVQTSGRVHGRTDEGATLFPSPSAVFVLQTCRRCACVRVCVRCTCVQAGAVLCECVVRVCARWSRRRRLSSPAVFFHFNSHPRPACSCVGEA